MKFDRLWNAICELSSFPCVLVQWVRSTLGTCEYEYILSPCPHPLSFFSKKIIPSQRICCDLIVMDKVNCFLSLIDIVSMISRINSRKCSNISHIYGYLCFSNCISVSVLSCSNFWARQSLTRSVHFARFIAFVAYFHHLYVGMSHFAKIAGIRRECGGCVIALHQISNEGSGLYEMLEIGFMRHTRFSVKIRWICDFRCSLCVYNCGESALNIRPA